MLQSANLKVEHIFQQIMTYERFSILWDALVTSRPANSQQEPINETAGGLDTIAALIAYGEGDKSRVPKL